ncbi:glycosyl transferase family protein [Leptolyngbya sp. NIES-3755]|nr:glycosyl transferase family protein [Leptolyngbya sp. NIES-3755]
MPKVSVIIPNYNHARFLEQRIQSILNQTYQDFEIIYLDDASTDNSNEVFAQFKDDRRIRSILNQTNSGSPFKQWNKGIKAATGDYIWIAESDDYAAPDLLETLVPLLDEHPQVGIAYGQSQLVDEAGNLDKTMHYWTDDLDVQRWRNSFISRGIEECKTYLALKNTIPNASAVLIRRQSLEAIGYAEESLFLCGDWMTWIKILLQFDLAFSAKVLNYYRYSNTSVRAKSRSDALDLYEQIQIFAFLQQNVPISGKVAKKLKGQFVYCWVWLILQQHTLSLKRNFELYKASKQFDTWLELRLLKQFYQQTISSKKPAKVALQ